MKKRIFSIAYMFFLTLLCTGALSALKDVNQERIALNQEARLHRVILTVLDIPVPPDAGPKAVAALYEKRVRKVAESGKIVYLGLTPDGSRIAGYAFPVGGPGFWGPIYGMMGVTPDLSTVTGIDFYDHSETPGLGGRITEAWFRNQFKGKHLTPDSRGRFFEFVSPGAAAGPNNVDAITGASETSRRVEHFLNQDVKETLEFIKSQNFRGCFQKNFLLRMAAKSNGCVSEFPKIARRGSGHASNFRKSGFLSLDFSPILMMKISSETAPKA